MEMVENGNNVYSGLVIMLAKIFGYKKMRYRMTQQF